MVSSGLPTARLEIPTLRALSRDRIDRLLNHAWSVPLTVVVGPAGAGKTTAVSHLAARSTAPVLWYRATAVDGDAMTLATHLAAAQQHFHGDRPQPADLDDLWHWLGSWAAPHGILVVIDEFDTLLDEPSEQALARLVAESPTNVHLLVISRRRPSLNISRLHLTDLVTEVGPDDLRFRSWEVDRLFRELYGRPLAPDQVAELERRSGGWVAALQLFDLATAHLPPASRTATISRVGRRAGPDWDYLADNVLAGISDEHRQFLLATAPLERLDPTLCDALVDSRSSLRLLAELERAQLLTVAADDPSSYRCHEVLRSHLEALSVEEEGEQTVRKRCAIAAGILEDASHFPEALRAYCRAEDWDGARRVLGHNGNDLAAQPGGWLDRLPERLLRNDPWIILARARRYRNDGRLADAVATYEHVESLSLSTSVARTARAERFVTAALADRQVRPPVRWIRLIRDAAAGATWTEEGGDGEPLEHLAQGLGNLVTGDVRGAEKTLRSVRDSPAASSTVVLAARLALALAAQLAGRGDSAEVHALERMAEALDQPFFVRLCGAVAASMVGSLGTVADAVELCESVGDEYGAALCEALAAFGVITDPRSAEVGTPRSVPNWSPSPDRCHGLGLDALAWWIELVRIARTEADAAEARRVEQAARKKGATSIAQLAAALAEPDAALASGAAEELRRDHDLSAEQFLRAVAACPTRHAIDPADDSTGVRPSSRSEEASVIAVHCMGGLDVEVEGETVDLGMLRPRARALLAMLAIRSGEAVHRDVLCSRLWPSDGPDDANPKLHVAVSTVRRVLRTRTDAATVERIAESYVLPGPPVADVDVAEFWSDAALAGADTSVDQWPTLAAAALRRRRGPILPEFGSQDWVVDEQRRLDRTWLELCGVLASWLSEHDQPDQAVTWCRQALEIDRWSDPHWRLLIDGLREAGDMSGWEIARRRYEQVLCELGVETTGDIEPAGRAPTR